MSKNQYYVYIYSDPDTMTPFYIGKGQRARYKFHLWEAKQYGKRDPVRFLNIPKIKKINTILEKGRDPVIAKVFHGSHEDCLAEEKRLIALMGRVPNGPLLNLTDGGDGTAGYKCSPEQCKAMSERRKGQKGHPHSEEHKQHLRDNNPGIVMRKKVLKLLPDATIVDTFESMTAAAKSVGRTKSNFGWYSVMDGSMPLGGFFYRYEGSSDIASEGIKDAAVLLERRNAHARGAMAGKAVSKVEGDNITIYESVKEASRAHPEVTYSAIWNAIKQNRILLGASWKYT